MRRTIRFGSHNDRQRTTITQRFSGGRNHVHNVVYRLCVLAIELSRRPDSSNHVQRLVVLKPCVIGEEIQTVPTDSTFHVFWMWDPAPTYLNHPTVCRIEFEHTFAKIDHSCHIQVWLCRSNGPAEPGGSFVRHGLFPFIVVETIQHPAPVRLRPPADVREAAGIVGVPGAPERRQVTDAVLLRVVVQGFLVIAPRLDGGLLRGLLGVKLVWVQLDPFDQLLGVQDQQVGLAVVAVHHHRTVGPEVVAGEGAVGEIIGDEVEIVSGS